MAVNDQLGGADNHSTVVRAAVAAAATGAAAYGVQRWRSSQRDRTEGGEADEPVHGEEEEQSDERGWSDKREELTQALVSKAADTKKIAAKLSSRSGKSQRSRADSDEADETADREEEGQNDERGWSQKREELTQALTSKASEGKKAAMKLAPGNDKSSSSVESVWESTSPHVLRFAKDAASALGATTAKGAPDLVREELMPSFIDGFESAT